MSLIIDLKFLSNKCVQIGDMLWVSILDQSGSG